MAETKTVRINQTRWSSGQDTVKREDFDSDAASLEQNVAVYKEGTLAERPAAGVGGRFYTVKGDPTASNNRRQYYDNGIDWAAVSYTTNQLAESTDSSLTPLTVRAAVSPTVDTIQVNNNAGVNQFRVSPDGYITNQTVIGSAPGVAFGYDVTHSAAGQFDSVNPSNPVVVIRGAAEQTANLLDVRDVNNVTLAYIDRSGALTTSGPISTYGLTSSQPISAPSVNISGPSSLKDVTISGAAANDIALTVKPFVGSSLGNVIELYSPAAKRVGRVLGDGSFATNGRLLVGNNEGDSGNFNYDLTVAAATIQNNIDPTTPVLNLVANATSQTGKMLQVIDAAGSVRFSVDPTGAFTSTANGNAASFSVGSGTTSPTRQYNGTVPKFEVITGAATGAYDESVIVRHAANSTAAASRKVGLKLKLSDESTLTESNKWAGIYAYAPDASAASVGLYFYAAGAVAGYFDATNKLTLNGSVQIPGSKALLFTPSNSAQIYLAGVNNLSGTIGVQSGNTTFIRSDQFAIYSGGSYNSSGLNSGGGLTMASFTSERAIMKRLTLTDPSSFDTTAPVLQIGGSDQHIQFSNYSINSYADNPNQDPSELNLQNNGGPLRLGSGNTIVSVVSRRLHMGHYDDTGSNAILFNGSANGTWQDQTGRAPRNNDWWFDSTDNTIKVYDGSEWKTFHHD